MLSSPASPRLGYVEFIDEYWYKYTVIQEKELIPDRGKSLHLRISINSGIRNFRKKFFLPCLILETTSYNVAKRAWEDNPLRANEIIICYYQFARRKAPFFEAEALP
jgi:hypothetical protein